MVSSALLGGEHVVLTGSGLDNLSEVWRREPATYPASMNISEITNRSWDATTRCQCLLFVVLNWASWVNFDLSSLNVVSYREPVGARAAVRSAIETEGLIHWPVELRFPLLCWWPAWGQAAKTSKPNTFSRQLG
jgi:hypothetical protein